MTHSIGDRFYDEDRGIHQPASKGVKPLSAQQLRALKCLRDGQDVASHCRTSSDYGGLHGTMFSLLQRGYIDKEHVLTDMGRRAIEREDHRNKPRE